jgi:MFS transporter, CP family, cyanate transporter
LEFETWILELTGAVGCRTRLLLLWLAGASLRMTLLAVPPLLAQIHHGLHLTETEVGSLTGLPVLLLAVAAVPGSLLVAKLGARRALLIGLAAIALAGAARGLSASVPAHAPLLFAMTFLMGCGVAISQPSLPSLVKAWMGDAVGLATATFANGMLIGEIAPVALTAPFILPLFAGSWPAGLAFWSAPVALTGMAVLFLTKHEPDSVYMDASKWWPDWGNGQTWLLGLTLGGASAAYWGANAFIPDFLRAHHHGAYITAALTALNVVQLPASFIVAALPGRVIARSWPLSLAGCLTIGGAVGIIALPPIGLVAAAGLLGFSTALVFVLALSLPPLLAAAGDTHRLSAAMFTISYACPFAGSLLGGGLWDATGVSQAALAPLFMGGLMVIVLPARLNLLAGMKALEPRPAAAPVP